MGFAGGATSLSDLCSDLPRESVSGDGEWALELIKGVHGLKQAGCTVLENVDATIRGAGLTATKVDRFFYHKRSVDGSRMAMLLLYVDNILLLHNWDEEAAAVERILKERNDVKSLGKLKYFLGIKFETIDNKGTFISQEAYANELLRRFGIEGYTTKSISMTPRAKIDADCGKLNDNVEYQQVVGGLLYLSTCTRTDIAFAVGPLAKRTENPTEENLAATLDVLAYLQPTAKFGLWIGISEPAICIWTDADCASDAGTRRSVSGAQ